MGISSEKKLELLYDHYKDTFSFIRVYMNNRDRVFYYLILMAFILILVGYGRHETTKIIEHLISANLEIKTLDIGSQLLSTIIQFLYFSLVIKYVQLNLLVNKQYKYLHEIEAAFMRVPFEIPIRREGYAYDSKSHNLRKFIELFYRLIFPLVLLIIVICNWIKELNQLITTPFNTYFILNTLFTLLVSVTLIMYLIQIHLKKSDLKKSGK